MPVKTETIHYEDQQGYLALPERAATPLPAVIVIQEAGGVDDSLEDITRRIAASGYVALAPDLFAIGGSRSAPLSRERMAMTLQQMLRFPPGAMFNPATREEVLGRISEPDQGRLRESLAQMFALMTPDHMKGFVEKLRKAVRHLRTVMPQTRGQKVACVGFCMGGGLSALLACEEPELAGAAIFYGIAPPAEKVPQINAPVVAFYGSTDQRVNAGISGFEDAMRKSGKSFEYHVYEGAGHAFFNDALPSYEVKAARDSFARLLSFFAKTLTG